MQLSKSYSHQNKRNHINYTLVFLLLLITFTSAGNTTIHNNIKTVSLDNAGHWANRAVQITSKEFLESNSYYAPGIAAILTTTSTDFFGGSPGCSYINIKVDVYNTSTNGESLNITTIDLGPDITIDSFTGDDNGNDILETNETWSFYATRKILDSEKAIDQAEDSAYVEAEVVGQPGVTVKDFSHGFDINDNFPTRTNLSSCTYGLALIKTGKSKNVLGEDGGCAFIEYTFLVTHNGDPAEGFESVEVYDTNIGGFIAGGPIEGDIINFGSLDPNEEWVYKVSYPLTAEDLLEGQVEGQAYVTASSSLDTNIIGSDISDFEDYSEDRPTIIDIPECVPRIGLLLTAKTKDGFGEDGGCALIEYRASVTNLSGVDQTLGDVTLSSLDLPLAFVGPEGDLGDDGLMGSGETWTYTATYIITADDITSGEVQNRAYVTANLQGPVLITVEDLSDYENLQEDRPTVTDLSQCMPIIGLIKTGVLNEDCTSITYTFTVTNESSNDQVLENVLLEDLDIPLTIEGPEGDLNDDTFLDLDETWTYTATYPVKIQDINLGFVDNLARVTADVIGVPGLSVEDLSHDFDVNEDGDTTVDLSSCQTPSIGLIKESSLVDIDQDGCPESILYEFTLTNTGDADLKPIILKDDELLGGEVPGPDPNTDEGNDDLLSVGESWSYFALYALTQQDIDDGFVMNQASVTAETLGGNTQVQDDSDDNSLAENDPTNTIVPNNACTDGAADLELLKEGTLVDIDQDDCFETIGYTFTVTNTGGVDLDSVTLEDELLGGELSGPVPGSDNGDDGILSVGESWTYEALYALTQQNIDDGSVDNQATVSAQPVGFDATISQNTAANTLVPNDACTDGAAGLDLIKVGTLIDVNQDGCDDSIFYTFTLTNIGSVDLEEVKVEDGILGGELTPDSSSDVGNDGILSQGESWTYEALYALIQQDINKGSVDNEATATAQPVGSDATITQDAMANTIVPGDACNYGSARLGLIKEGVLTDTDSDECPESILYTFTLTNNGSLDLDSVEIIDEMLSGVISLDTSSDQGNDGILSVGESWTYSSLYAIIQLDIDQGKVENQARVSAQPVGLDAQVLDLSDDNSLDEDQPTITIVPMDACSTDDDDPNFEIYTGITPNGDGINDYFRIDGIESYPNNTLRIFNRWGVLIYETEGYGLENNLFKGFSEGRATILKERTLPSGTYFYILTFPNENPGQENYSGYIYINRD
ncbi:gliding motility-associated C-terminal domain-containing protein [Flagellimonas nanhaiensis]|uniref:Gliding motility-associated C-terminal domain-containing protein n=1 Tax=Flagellimonas nanhaiensis TaxID=2292706 RepID=A0A371JV56_9FLAO|nr:gliding motility-associated C-terminal domain-containing protein [Allomuricauda nanhaiensis]RDY61699.1 gliding motility-associated C-terminal domain-containing protein [Allomuricauda nanhaiensis]